MNILIKPVISEKTMTDASAGKYTFFVNTSVNKHQIEEAIKQIYKVKVKKINIISVKAEEKMVKGKFQSKGKVKKKAIVTLEKNQKIEGFEIKE
jgi:large subunit ribosomal protein L23